MKFGKLYNIIILLLIGFILVFCSNLITRAVQMGGSGMSGGEVLIDDIAGASRIVVKNMNDSEMASAQMNMVNDQGEKLSIGIGSSNLSVAGTEGPNSGALLLESDANLAFAMLFRNAFIWKINTLDDGDLSNLIEIMRLNSMGLNIDANLQADDYYSGDGSQGITEVVQLTTVGGGLCTLTIKDGLITNLAC
jgi:hypothetical protein